MSDPYNSAKSKKDPWREVPVKKDRTRNPSESLSLWSLRWSVARGHHWEHERRVTVQTAGQWLQEFQKDEPRTLFVVSEKKPTAALAQKPRQRNPLDLMTALNAAGDIAMIKEFSDEKKAGAFKVRRKNPFGEGVCPPHLKKFRFRKVK